LKTDIERLFLAYANLPFDLQLSESLNTIYQISREYISFDKDYTTGIDIAIKYTELFKEYSEFDSIDECIDKLNLKHIRRGTDFDFFNIAFESYYGFGTRCDFCIPVSMRERKKIFDHHWAPPENFNCFLCNRQLFHNILNEIIMKKELSFRINAAIDISLNAAYDAFKTIAEIETERNSEDRFKIKKKNRWWETLDSVAGTTLIDDIFYLGTYSLSEFLLNNDSRKLKVCKQCKKYYISNQIQRSKFCSSKHRQLWHNTEHIKSGKHKEYKRKKRAEGAKASYYG